MADRYKTAAGQASLGRSRRRRRGRLLAAITFAVAGAALTVSSGCSTAMNLQEALMHNASMDDFMIGYRNKAWSAKAWHRNKHHHCDHKHMADFCNGFRQGYEDVAGGSDGCTPAVAPQDYWGWRYQSAEGQAKVGAWFAGYPMGAKAAEEDGIGNWSQLQTNFPAPAPVDPYVGLTGAGVSPIGLGGGAPHPAVPIGAAQGMPIEPIPVPAIPLDSGAGIDPPRAARRAIDSPGAVGGDVQSQAEIAELFGLTPAPR